MDFLLNVNCSSDASENGFYSNIFNNVKDTPNISKYTAYKNNQEHR